MPFVDTDWRNAVEFAAATYFGNIYLYSLKEAQSLRTYEAFSNFIYEISWDSTGSFLSSYAENNQYLKIFLPINSKCLYKLDHKSEVLCSKWYPLEKENDFIKNGLKLITGCNQGIIRIWSMENGTCIQSFELIHQAGVHCISIFSNGELMCSSSIDKKICLFNLKNKKILRYFSTTQIVNDISWSFDGHYFSAASGDNILIVDVNKLLQDIINRGTID